MPNKYGKCTRDFGAFLFLFESTFLYFGGVFNKTIILLAFVGYEMIIAPRWLSIISYPTRTRRIIVKDPIGLLQNSPLFDWPDAIPCFHNNPISEKIAFRDFASKFDTRLYK